MGSQVLHERDAVACVGSPTADQACLDQPASPRGCRAFLQSQDFLQSQAFLKASPKPEQSRSGGDVQHSCHLGFGGAVTRTRRRPTVLPEDHPPPVFDKQNFPVATCSLLPPSPGQDSWLSPFPASRRRCCQAPGAPASAPTSRCPSASPSCYPSWSPAGSGRSPHYY